MIIVVISLGSNISLAQEIIEEGDKQWIQELSDKSTNMVWENLRKQFNDSDGLPEDVRLKGHQLYIFISSSMPVTLLKQYFKAASMYDGILVLKGLPKGSFKELSKIIMEIAGVKLRNEITDAVLEAQIIIDEEAFSKFKIQEVPAVVLSISHPYFPGKDREEKCDKITGNVGVKYALENFSKEGELAVEAMKHLNFKKQD